MIEVKVWAHSNSCVKRGTQLRTAKRRVAGLFDAAAHVIAETGY
jgi:hypothetical protein